MKQKKFKIEGTTLFVYRAKTRLNQQAGAATDPTTAITTTAVYQK